MEEDRLSNLPKTILHDILSRLPEEDAARTSVLSKAWAETWSTFPILSFSDTKIIRMLRQPNDDVYTERKKFLDYVERTLLRFRDQGLAIREFKLRANTRYLNPVSKDVDIWMKLVCESGVEVLELCQPGSVYGLNENEECWDYCYILPTGVLEAKSLRKLLLSGRIRVDLALMNHSMKLFSLQVLSLDHVLLGDEQAIKHLISCCPLIEFLTLTWCYVLNPGGEGHLLMSRTSLMKSLSICGLPRLKGVDVQGIQEVYVDAPSLKNLCYCPDDLQAPSKLDFNRCRNLRELCLWSLKNTIITDEWFLELFAKFPFLESLSLDDCTMSERINISSVQLKVLELSNCFDLKEVNIDAPNLLSCGYSGCYGVKPIISFLSSSSQLEIDVLIDSHNLDLCNLREFIQNFKPQTVLPSVSLLIDGRIARILSNELNPVVMDVSSPPPCIKHLAVRSVPKNETSYLPLINGLLSSCCPATISVGLCSRYWNNLAFIELFYETLMGRNKDECFCSSGHTKCWWHGLKDVEVASSMNTDENVDFKTILDALCTASAYEEDVSFWLEF